MLYRGFRIESDSPQGSSRRLVILETCRAHWRRIGTAGSMADAERFVDQLLAGRQKLFGSACVSR